MGMKLRDAIELADDRKPNAFTARQKVRWLESLDGHIAAEDLLLNPAELEQISYSEDELDTELLIKKPYDDIYPLWLMAQIDFANGEYEKYQNSMALYNAQYGQFACWFAEHFETPPHRPPRDWRGFYYLTAYGVAVKHGYRGTEEEWLESLQGAQGEDGHGFVILGQFDTAEQLEAGAQDPQTGDAYCVGTVKPYNVYIYTRSGEWMDYGTMQGDKGDTGEKGDPGAKGAKGDKGDKGDPFTYEDFTPAQLAALKGDKGDRGEKGDKGDTGAAGAQGAKGEKGDPGAKGDKGDTGAKGDKGDTGAKGDKGDTGAGFAVLDYYASLSALQAAVPSPNVGDAYGVGTAEPYDIYIYGETSGWTNNGPLQGAKGDTGAKGDKGDKGDPFTYEDFTPEQLASLKGEKGDKGDPGVKGDKGDKGEDGVIGRDGAVFTPAVDASGNLSWSNNGGLDNPPEVNIKGPKGDTGSAGPAGQNGQAGSPGQDGVGVSSVVQTTTSTADSGENIVTMTLTNGQTATFTIKNGSKGSAGSAGAKGDKGDKGDPFTYSDFTAEQLAALKGPKGDKGDKGDTGATGATGAAGAQGAKGDKGDTGATGPAGTSVTHSWSGTNLTLTSASGTTTTNLGLQYTISQTDLTAGVSALASGTLYFQYE